MAAAQGRRGRNSGSTRRTGARREREGGAGIAWHVRDGGDGELEQARTVARLLDLDVNNNLTILPNKTSIANLFGVALNEPKALMDSVRV